MMRESDTLFVGRSELAGLMRSSDDRPRLRSQGTGRITTGAARPRPVSTSTSSSRSISITSHGLAADGPIQLTRGSRM